MGRRIRSFAGGSERRQTRTGIITRIVSLLGWRGRGEGGVSYGESDEVGHKAAVDKVHDFHATILHLLGFDHEQLTYRYGGGTSA